MSNEEIIHKLKELQAKDEALKDALKVAGIVINMSTTQMILEAARDGSK